jgi:anti-sigma factor RsiW
MTHPEDLLAGYVDGVLSPAERAAVDTHLSGCDRCRHEVALATAARGALAALPEVPAPAGVADRALAQAGVAPAPAASGPPRWYRIAGIAAAAAAVALVLVVVLPNPKGGDEKALSADTAAGADAGGGALAPEMAASRIEVRDADYTAADLATFIAPFQREASSPGAAAADQARAGSDAETERALACLNTAAPDAGTGLVQLIQARFEGQPAYFGVFLEGPGAGQPNDKGTVWVVSRRDCAILSFAQARL